MDVLRRETHVCDWLYSVYCNGSEYEPSRQVVVPKRMLVGGLRDVFDEISQHIKPHFGVISKLVSQVPNIVGLRESHTN